MQLLNFLQLVLPQEGVKCWAAINKSKKVTQGFTPSFEELVEKLKMIDAKGQDAYFACAAFHSPTTRRGENALGAKAFWLDIDCGLDKAAKGLGYASSDIALQALDNFATALGLSLPMVVCSGSGLHAYWLLADTVTAADWLPVARALKLLTAQSGLLADPSRTADIASILRPLETRNYKREPAEPVYLDSDDTEVIAFAKFKELIGAALQPAQPAHALIGADNLAAAMLGGRAAAPVTEGVQEGGRNQACARFVGAQLAQGKTSQEAYDAAMEWNKKNQPPLDEQEVRSVVNSITRAEAQKPAPPPITVDDPIPRPQMPKGFSAAPDGAMFARIEDENGETTVVPMAAYECYLIAVCRKEREAKESYAFYANHPHNGWHQFLISRHEFDSSSWLAAMGENCTDILNPKAFRSYVRAAAVEMKGHKMDAVRYEQFGWKDNHQAFLIGNALMRSGKETLYAYGDDHLEPRMKGMKLQKGSSRHKWTVAANKLFAPGFEAHGFALIASFAAPLMTFVCGATDGGAILALHTQGSGFGKSNALQGIASVWGAYDSLGVSGTDTENAKFNIISKACHLPVYEEEMGQNDPSAEAAIIKRFINGKDKNRARRDGSVEYKDTRFQTIMISASNHSLADILKIAGDQGAIARVFELSIPAPLDKEAFKDFSKITAEMLDNHGHAGREFIAALLYPGMVGWVRQALEKSVTEYITLFETTAKDRYVVYLIACCHVAAKVLNSVGILNFDAERVMAWVLTQAKARIEDGDNDSALDLINEFISENIMDCLVVEKAFSPKTAATIIRYPKNRIVMRMERENGRLFILHQPLRLWLAKHNYHMGTLTRLLDAVGVLNHKSKQVTMTAGTDFTPLRAQALELDMNHVAITGAMQLVKKLPEAENEEKMSF